MGPISFSCCKNQLTANFAGFFSVKK